MRAFILNRHSNVLRVGRDSSQSKTQRIRAKLVDDIDWVDTIALAFAHGFPEPIQDLGVNEDFLEWNLADVVQTHQYHAGYP